MFKQKGMALKIVLVFSLCLITCLVHSQEGASWKVVLNKKIILNGKGQEDTAKNKLQIKKSELSNNSIFKIEYIEPMNSTAMGWKRTMAIMDTASVIIVQYDSSSILQLYNKDMMKILWNRKKVNVFTWARPLDPGMAAAIRLRRLHLCSIELVE